MNCSRLLLCLVVAWPVPAVLAQRTAERPPGDGYVRFQDVNELIANWRPESHLYVLGDLPLSSAELSDLESWLDQNGPHWTVLLLETAAGQHYVADDGRSERGMDAVELALGKGLMELPPFQEQVNERTQEPDGAVFVLFLRERKFSYRASVAQDRRGLGAAQWIGRLDRPAFQAMRGGGRIGDAVRDTVSSITRALDQRISGEIQAAIQRDEARRVQLASLRTRLATQQQRLEQVEQLAAQLRDSLPSAGGDLAARDFSDLRNRIATWTAQAAEAGEVPAGLEQAVAEIGETLDEWENAYAEFERFDASQQDLQQRLSRLSARGEAAGQQLQQARAALEASKQAHSRGESAFQRDLNRAKQALDEAAAAITVHQQAEEAAAARRALIRRTALITGGLAAIVLLGVVVWLNRRRQGVKQRAVERLQTRQNEVKSELEGVWDLIERAQTVIGDRAAVDRKGYTGTTRDVSLAALGEVDDLLVMSNSVERVLEQAARLVQPGALWGMLINLVSGARFQKGFDLLDREPIRFGENEGVSLVIDDKAPPAANESKPTGEEPAATTLSFSQLFQLFRTKYSTAKQAIDRVEYGWSHIIARAAEVQGLIDAAQQAERRAEEAAENDGLFPIPSLFERLIPAAQADQDRGEDLGRTDPVQAIEGPLADAARKAEDARLLAELAVQCREQLLPGVERGTEALHQRSRQVHWVHDGLAELGAAAEALAQQAVEQPAGDAIRRWYERVEHLEAEVRRTLQLHEEAVKAVGPAIQSSRDETAAARRTIVERLQTPAEETLNEQQAAPDRILDTADGDLAAAYNNLDRGDTEGATLALQAARKAVGQAVDVVRRSLTALRELPGLLDAAAERLRQERAKTPSHQELLDELSRDYAASAFVLSEARPQPADAPAAKTPATPDEPRLAGELVGLAAQQQQIAEQHLAGARQAYARARLLEAEGRRQTADAALASSEARLLALREHADSLRRTAQENETRTAELQRSWRALQANLEDRRATERSRDLGRQASAALAGLQDALRGRLRDPWQERRESLGLNEQLGQLEQSWRADQAAYDEAERSIAAIATQLSRAETLVDQSRNDRIPDSQAVVRETDAVRRMATAYDSLRARISRPHQDWDVLDREADQLTADLAAASSRLESDLRQAQQAAQSLAAAGDAVRMAERWSGPFQVMISSSAGRTQLQQARTALSRGDYAAAIQAGELAQRLAQDAVLAAQREVERRRREQQRRLEEERRRERMANSTSIGSSSFGAGGSSFGSSSRSSSSSGSGSGGFSRSGW